MAAAHLPLKHWCLGGYHPVDTVVTLQGTIEQGGPCETVGSKGIIVALLGHVVPKGCCDYAGHSGPMETIAALQGSMKPKGHCDPSGPHGSKGPL